MVRGESKWWFTLSIMFCVCANKYENNVIRFLWEYYDERHNRSARIHNGRKTPNNLNKIKSAIIEYENAHCTPTNGDDVACPIRASVSNVISLCNTHCVYYIDLANSSGPFSRPGFRTTLEISRLANQDSLFSSNKINESSSSFITFIFFLISLEDEFGALYRLFQLCPKIF